VLVVAGEEGNSSGIDAMTRKRRLLNPRLPSEKTKKQKVEDDSKHYKNDFVVAKCSFIPII
jgi:hypothetical protein